MLVAPENNTEPKLDPSFRQVPVARPDNSTPDSTHQPEQPAPAAKAAVPEPAPKKKRFPIKKAALIAGIVLFFAVSVASAYLIGRGDERVIIQAPPTEPLNLPPQAVVTAECVPGRGKQYIIPKNIPQGPIYDVLNNKVIAIEYNLNIAEITANPDSLSSTILDLTRKYPVDHFSLVPETPKAGKQSENIHLIMFIVSKEEAASIKCDKAS